MIWITLSLMLWSVGGAESEESNPQSVAVSIVAIQATHENREEKHFDPALDDLRAVLGQIEPDTFRLLKSAQSHAGYGEQVKVPIAEQYTLFVTPVEKDSAGCIRIQARIEERISTKEGMKTRNALKATRVVMPPGKHVVLCGLKLGEGELIVVISVCEPVAQVEPSTESASAHTPDRP